MIDKCYMHVVRDRIFISIVQEIIKHGRNRDKMSSFILFLINVRKILELLFKFIPQKGLI